MEKINASEYETLMTYIASFYILHQNRLACGYIYNSRFFVIKYDIDRSALVVKGLTENERSAFICDFGFYALQQLFKLYQPKEGYFIFNADDQLFLTAIVQGKLKLTRIREEDLKKDE